MKPRVKEAIVVEGKYDAQRVREAVEGLVVQTEGFRLFRDPEKVTLLRRLAAERGLIVLTDSDSAGMVIRNHLLSLLPPEQVRQAYVPPIPGKERRKAAPSKEGLLGVEGVDAATVEMALRRSGATFLEEAPEAAPGKVLTKADLYALGLSGREDSARLRQALLQELGLPAYLSANRLLEVLSATVSPEELTDLLEKVRGAETLQSKPK